MTDQNVYALNKISGVVTQVDASFLSHPTLGKDLVEVEGPNVCIDCGEQPSEVVTTEGETISLEDIEYTSDPLDMDEPDTIDGEE